MAGKLRVEYAGTIYQRDETMVTLAWIVQRLKLKMGSPNDRLYLLRQEKVVDNKN
jgi:hypothetical protein